MVKINRTQPAPASLAVEKKNGTLNYRGKDVVSQLNKDFHGKCYLCEINKLQSIQIEHLKPHHGKDFDLMFDWNNLFLSCPHCNNMKNQKKYEGHVIDCCKEDPEASICQELIDGHVVVTSIVSTDKAVRTAELLTECFEKQNTGIREYECSTRVEALEATMTTLYRCLANYKKKPNTRNYRALRGMLSRGHKFAGFTRTYVRKHIDEYPELNELVAIA